MRTFVCLLLFCALCCFADLSAQSIETLIPSPKTAYASVDTVRFRIGPSTMLVLPDSLTPAMQRAALWLEREVKRRCGITLQRRTIFYYVRSLPPFQSAIVLLPSTDRDTIYFRNRVFAHGEDGPTIDGGYILDVRQTETIMWCRENDESSFNAVTTFLNLLNTSTVSAAQCHVWDEPDYPVRWIYSQHNLQVASNVGVLRAMADSMAALKLNGIYQNDFKLGILGKVSSQYFRNTDTLKQVWLDRNVEVIPGVCGIGWSSNILLNDNQLAEGIEARTLYYIEGDTGRCIPNAAVSLPNGGFETVDGQGRFTNFSFYDTCFHQDKSVFHRGAASAKATNIPVGTNARFNRSLSCKPHEYYTLSAWFKTANCTADEFRIMVLADTGTNQYAAITFTNLSIAATSDWQKVEVYFNTLDYSKILLYAGIWGARGGTLWIDDFEIKPAGLCNLLRRSGTPLTVKNAVNAQVYAEGVDFNVLHDTWWDSGTDNLGPYHTPPTFRIGTGSHIRNGDSIEIRYFHPFAAVSDNQGNGSVMVCVSEDTLYSILRRQVSEVDNLYKPHRYFMGHDEIRSMNRDDACLARGRTPAQLLSDNIQRCQQIIQTQTPGAQTFIWSDMIDSLHNAVNRYYLVNGDLSGSWNLSGSLPVVVNWNSSKRTQSLTFFAQHGYQQISSPYYDVGNSSTIRSWRIAQDSIPGMLGMMYTTWNADYRFLRPFAYYAWSAGPYIMHAPLDSTLLGTSQVDVVADIRPDPFDPSDDITEAVIMMYEAPPSQAVVERIMTRKVGTMWSSQISLNQRPYLYYRIRSRNKQGLRKQTPIYRLGRPVDTTSSVAANAIDELFVFPQPVQSILTCRLSGEHAVPLDLSIVDLQGTSVMRTTVLATTCTNENFRINVGFLAAGRYNLVLEGAEKRRIVPFVKLDSN